MSEKLNINFSHPVTHGFALLFSKESISVIFMPLLEFTFYCKVMLKIYDWTFRQVGRQASALLLFYDLTVFCTLTVISMIDIIHTR